MSFQRMFFPILCLFVCLLAACATVGDETAVPTVSDSELDVADQRIYEGTRFSVRYPTGLTFYENERPSADGVMAPLEGGIALQGDDFLLTVTPFDIQPGVLLTDFIDDHAECSEVSSTGGQPAVLGNLTARLYLDTLCGLNGITYLYAVQGSTGYRLAIESSEAFASLESAIQPILDSFQAEDRRPITRVTEVEHSGISLRYEPALLGDVTIQDVAATADQGMFGGPTPAHTWIGFDTEGSKPQTANHWTLSREPQVLVFNLADFGSFAQADTQAREKIAAFAQLLAERTPTFSGEVPILPPINAAQAMHAQAKWLDFEGGTGLRFITAHTQEVIPVANDRLVYIFYGMTSDGRHGIMAVIPVSAATLPDTPPSLSEAEIIALNENYESQMAAVSEQLNGLADADFDPPLSELDALVRSIAIKPTDDDYPVTSLTPQNAQVSSDVAIYAAPSGLETVGALAAGEAVVVNGRSNNGDRNRILCPNGSTGNCWLPSDVVQITDVSGSEPGTTGGLVDGQVVMIKALVENVIFAAPSEAAAPLGSLRVGEVAEVLATDASGDWYNIACPRNIGVNCWVITNAAVNEPVGFFSSDNWKDVIGEHVSFRVPVGWNPKAISPGSGSVHEHWHLGIPGVEADQEVAFFSIAFDLLQPPDLESETPIEIGGQPGEKWLRSGRGYVSYDYYTTGVAGAGSFGIHVTVPEADPELEALMDMLAASVTFGTKELETSGSGPRFDRYLSLAQREDGSGQLFGLVRQGDGWQVESVHYPVDSYSTNSDYAPASDRLLVWHSLKGVGPGSIAAGPLTIIDLTTHAQQTVVSDNVVSAGWAPDGLDFAYILATPDSYELFWQSAAGEDTQLAIDVPHSLRVSPDGRFVAFTRESHYGLTSAVPGLYVVNVETGEEIQVSTLDRAGYGGAGPFWKPIWSPDSSQLILYAAADNDRAPVPHETGYAWAAADGSFSHFLPESAFLAYYDEPISTPANVPCLGTPPLFAANRLVLRVGECQPMMSEPESATTIVFGMDPQTGTVTRQQILTIPADVELLAWDVPGESLFVRQDGQVTTLSIR